MIKNRRTRRAQKTFLESYESVQRQISGSYKSHFEKVPSRWKNTNKYGDLSVGHMRDGNMYAVSGSGLNKHSVKALPGRGARRKPWTADLYAALLSEFERLQAMRVKLFPGYLVVVAKARTKSADHSSSFHHERTFTAVSGNKACIMNKDQSALGAILYVKQDIVMLYSCGKLSVIGQE